MKSKILLIFRKWVKLSQKIGMFLFKLISSLIPDLFLKAKESLGKIKTWIAEIKTLKLHVKLYRIGFILIAVAVVLYLIFDQFLIVFKSGNEIEGIDKFKNNARIYYYYLQVIMFGAIITLFAISYILEKIDYYENIKKNKILLTIILTAVFFIVYVSSELLISHFINDFTSLDPNYFGVGKIALKLVFIPYVWACIITVYLSVYLGCLANKVFFREHMGLIKSSFVDSKKSHKKVGLSYVEKAKELKETSKKLNQDSEEKTEDDSRKAFMSSMTLFFTLSIVAIPIFFKETPLLKVPQFLILHSEYYSRSYCKNVFDKNNLVADIGGGNVSVYSALDEQFYVAKCEIDYDYDNRSKGLKGDEIIIAMKD